MFYECDIIITVHYTSCRITNLREKAMGAFVSPSRSSRPGGLTNQRPSHDLYSYYFSVDTNLLNDSLVNLMELITTLFV